MMPARKKRPKMGVRESSVIECHGHQQWVRNTFACAIAGHEGHECNGKNHFHHMKTRGAGGGDETGVPLCPAAHDEWHKTGRDSFKAKYGIDLDKMAAHLWQVSPHGRKWRLEHERP